MEDVKDIDTAKVYWTCRQSVEAENYGDTAPCEPYPVKVRTGDNTTVAYAHCFDPDTGEIDDDSNATAMVRPLDLFDTEAAAWTAYRKLAISHVADLLHSASYTLCRLCNKKEG